MTNSMKLGLIAAATITAVSIVAAYVVVRLFERPRFEALKSTYEYEEPGLYVLDTRTGTVRYCTHTDNLCRPMTEKE